MAELYKEIQVSVLHVVLSSQCKMIRRLPKGCDSGKVLTTICIFFLQTLFFFRLCII
jgi:hypothetical protein